MPNVIIFLDIGGVLHPDLWRLTEHKTAGGTDILLNEEKAVPDVDTELLEHLVGNVK